MKKKSSFDRLIDKVPKFAWMIISITLLIILWQIISMTERGGKVFAAPWVVFITLIESLEGGYIIRNTGISLFRVLSGFLIAFLCAVPAALAMGWYKIIRVIFEPWVQFIRVIPPIAYLPLVIVAAGVGEGSKIAVIFIGAFLVMLVTIYQGILNVDETMIKATRVLGAKDFDIFFRVVVPASLPFILTALRLGLATALGSLVAAEMTGASEGLGSIVQTAGQYFQMQEVLMCVLIIGVIGMVLEKIIKIIEKRLTGWQEKRSI